MYSNLSGRKTVIVIEFRLKCAGMAGRIYDAPRV